MADHCPVCLNSVEWRHDRDYGDKKQIRCLRCGPFEISRTALAMLDRRVNQDSLVRARLSHAIRLRTSEENWLFINSTNLDELAQLPLPGVQQQIQHLVFWLAGQLGDNRLGRIPYPQSESLAGMIGTVDGEHVERLIEYADRNGTVDHDTKKRVLGLSPEGWRMIEQPKKKDESMPQMPSADAPGSVEIIKAHCNKCNGERNAYKHATHTVNGHDGEVSWSDTYDILECCGCNGLSVRHTFWFSEWDQFDDDPLTGQPRLIPGNKVTFWPPPTKRNMPVWAENLDDDVLCGVFDEVYQALNSGLTVLASIGTRTLLDRAMFLRVGDPKGGFAGKLDLMVENGHIGNDERMILDVITDAGSASAHRGFVPDAAALGTIIETAENFIHREFVLKQAADAVRTMTPSRQSRGQKPDGSN